MKVVADINVLVSGLIWPGPPASFLDAASRRHFHLLTSEDLPAELEGVLSRPHLQQRLDVRGRTVAEVMAKQRVLKEFQGVVIVSPRPFLATHGL